MVGPSVSPPTDRVPAGIPPGARLLTAAEFHRLSDVPPEVEWFANLGNPRARRAYENAVGDFMRFVGIARVETGHPLRVWTCISVYRHTYPALQEAHYDPEILRRAPPLVSRANPALPRSGRYLVATSADGTVVGCGGWSRERMVARSAWDRRRAEAVAPAERPWPSFDLPPTAFSMNCKISKPPSRSTRMDEAEGLHRFPMARRGFLMSSLISGFTLATAHADTPAIHTGSAGLVAGEVQIPVADGHLPGYAARPDGAGPFPIVLVIEEIFGVHEYIKDVCRRLAHLGYLAVAPELYARLADLSKITDAQQILREVIPKAPDATVLADLDATAGWAGTQHGDPRHLGVIGFCRGGRDSWLYAEHSPTLRAAVAFYGPVATPDTPIQPHSPLDLAARLKCPLLGLYGGQDTSIAQADVRAAQAKARAAGQVVEIVVYPDAPHGFHADYRPSYRKADAEAAWTRAVAWLRAHGVGG